jgi:DNA-binding transcriptional MerR regulator
MVDKAAGAFLTIGEVSGRLDIPQHILRYWETRFRQLRPLTRAGNRRYYRPDDVALVTRINALLNEQGYTIKGVQKLLSARGAASDGGEAAESSPAQPAPAAPAQPSPVLAELRAIRDRLARVLAEDDVAARV